MILTITRDLRFGQHPRKVGNHFKWVGQIVGCSIQAGQVKKSRHWFKCGIVMKDLKPDRKLENLYYVIVDQTLRLTNVIIYTLKVFSDMIISPTFDPFLVLLGASFFAKNVNISSGFTWL